jgi:hypothetical protein
MPGLSPEQIKAILAAPQKKRGKKKEIDTSVRDYATWFALKPQTIDDHHNDLRCDNPNCVDPRPGTQSNVLGTIVKHQFVVIIDNQKVCRFCFLDGWLLNNPDQDRLAV